MPATRRWSRTPRPRPMCGSLSRAYDATGDETPRPRRDDDFNPEQLMHELENFLRQERTVVRSDTPGGDP